MNYFSQQELPEQELPESGSSSLVESPKHQLGARRGARTKGKS